jgi:hypothetical protein
MRSDQAAEYSLTALAKVLGRAKSGLHKLAKNGQIPQLSNGRYDLAAVQKALDSNLDPSRRKRSQGEQKAVHSDEQVNKKISEPEDAKRAVSLIRQVLESESAYGGVIDFNAARTAELIVKTHQRWLEVEMQAKRLVDVQVVEELAFKFAREYRDCLMNWPSQIGAMLAFEIGSDPVRTIIALEKYIRQHLTEISDENQVRATAVATIKDA